MEASGWGFTFLVLLGYFLFLYLVFIQSGALNRYFRTKPYAFAWLGFIWTLVSSTALFVWSAQYSTPTNKNASSWFRIGPNDSLYLFNIPINTWWAYSIILIYQVTRSLVSSLISRVFSPFLITEISGKQLKVEPLSPTKGFYIQFALACATVNGYWGAASDIFLALTQIDLTLIGMLSTILFDSISLQKFMEERINLYRNPPSKKSDDAAPPQPEALGADVHVYVASKLSL